MSRISEHQSQDHSLGANIAASCLVHSMDLNDAAMNEDRPSSRHIRMECDDEVCFDDSCVQEGSGVASDAFPSPQSRAPRTRSRLISQPGDFSLTPLTMPSSTNASLYSTSIAGARLILDHLIIVIILSISRSDGSRPGISAPSYRSSN